jgi:hypothetical protein
MSKEKVVLAVIAIILGLFVAGGCFYVYQITRTVNPSPNTQLTSVITHPTPILKNENFLNIQDPKNEQVYNKRIINVLGKTVPGSTIIISSENNDDIVMPSAKGDFTLTATLVDGVNILQITAIFPNGQEQSVTRVITYTAEEF